MLTSATPSQRLDMQPSLVPGLDALADWRLALEGELARLESFLAHSDLLAPSAAAASVALRRRLTTDKLVVAFVAEFSRGKSELINAIFFADAGRRILPATPGRTTMCPVELSWDGAELPTLDLLPIATRRHKATLAEWCDQRDKWHRVPLDPSNPDALAASLQQVTYTQKVSRDEAQALGLWSEEHTADNPPTTEDGLVEIPAWRHAVINYPHPLLQRGLVVIDTPGLNAIGTEPELTLGLLPSAHAALFVLGADTGVTRSDLDIWTDHLGGQGLACFVVLNKMDTLADPLATPQEQLAIIERQRVSTAQTLGIPRERVFPVSARQALSARLQGDAAGLEASRLPILEAALNADLLPQRQRVLARAVISGVQSLLEHSTRRLRDQRRHNAEQMLELRGLRGKSAGRVTQMLERVHADTAEFERCTARLTALRTVHARLQRSALKALDADRVRDAVAELQQAIGSGWFNLRARAAFAKLCQRLSAQLDQATALCAEAGQMLNALFTQLNTEFGFSLVPSPAPELSPFKQELMLIERSYGRYFSVTRSMRLNSTAFSEQFQRMLVSKLRVIFENASGEIEAWNQAASGQIDGQFRERRRSFKRRRESLERIQSAAGELEQRLLEVENQDAKLLELVDRAYSLASALRSRAEQGPSFEPEAAEDDAGMQMITTDGWQPGTAARAN
ncbi:dynamin family protein [Ideonella azotifigens]|uniref:Dynamin-like GTPase family protein n=3 Tax=Ideonella azotifigens TaxID=513160 RepID=A0ABN1K621_9BURK|nr:dynamin family protein [Ideonella azotifigens]MCD2342491.1 dynamin family protein [Ideonella azotifigens]